MYVSQRHMGTNKKILGCVIKILYQKVFILMKNGQNVNVTKRKLDLKVLAPTLVMSTVSNIKDILIFSYSEINTNAKRKIAQFAESQGSNNYSI